MDPLVEKPSIYHRERKNLSNQQRQSIVELLFCKSQNTKLKRGALKEVAELYSISTKTVAKIWQSAKSCIANGTVVDVSSKLSRPSGRKRVQIDFNRVLGVPLHKRTNLRSLSAALQGAKTTLYRRKQEGAIRRHTSAIKPYLKEEGKRVRLQFCLSMLEPQSINNNPIFKGMYNYVHIDEKWFFMTKKAEKYYLLPSEMEPLRTCKSKSFITKIMFLAAVARPRYDATRNQEFSGKIGIFPFVFKEPSKRKSKNRAAGTMETKAVNSVTKDVIRSTLIQKVLPAIRAKWPDGNRKTIFIQQDNARPHVQQLDVEFLNAASTDGIDIRLLFQPANSPYLNVLDLGYFTSIQSLQHQEAPTTIDELVHAVEKSFKELPPENLNHVFLSLQSCMVEIIKDLGGNNYKVPHMGKKKKTRNGELPTQVQCSRDLVEMALAHLENEAI